MSYTAFSQPWPSGPPAFAWPDDPAPAQFAIDPLTAMLLAGGVTAGGVALLRKLLGRRQSAEQGGRSRGAAPTKAAPQNKYPMRISARAVPPPRPFFPAKVPEETSHEYKTPYGRTQAYRDEEFRPHGLPRQQVQQQPYYGYGGLSQQPPVRRPRNPHAAALSDDAAQFTPYEDYYQEYEPTEHDDNSYEPEPLDLRPEPVGMYEIAKHFGATDEEAEHLERLYAESRQPEGIDRKIEQSYHDPALLHASPDMPHHIADWHNKSWVRNKGAVTHKLRPMD